MAFTETFTITTGNPLLHGHVVYGRHILPGVGYVDLVLQVLARHGHAMSDVELRNLTILAPLAAAPGEEVVATVEARPAPKEGWRIEVRSRRRQDTEDVLHAVVAARRSTLPAFAERLSLPLTGVQRLTRLADIYTWLRAHDLVHSGLMKSEGTVHHRPADWVVELALPPENHGTADGFLFHPALFEAGLLGGSVNSHMLYEGSEADQALYLPLVFESFRATASLGRHCFVRVSADSASRDDELIRLAAEFYDTTGAKVAEIGRLVAKRVPAVTALDVRDAPAAHPAPAPAGTDPEASVVPRTSPGTAPAGSGPDVVALLRELVGARLGVPAAEVGTKTGYYQLGLGSAALVGLVAELEDRLGLELSPTVMFEYTTIADLAAWLETRLAAPGARQDARPTAAPQAGDPAEYEPPARASAVRAEVSAEMAALLELPVEEVDRDCELSELGFDLVGRAALVERLNDRYGLALTAAVLSAHPTVRELADHLAAQLAARHGDHAAPGTRPQEPGPDAARTRHAPSAPHTPSANYTPSVPHTSSAPDTPGRAAEPPHPLLPRPVPLDDGTAYRVRLDGSEPYLRDHLVRGERVLPGAAHLELAHAAVAAAPDLPPGRPVRLEDVVWLRPAAPGADGLEMHVAVRRAGEGLEFAVTAPAAGDGADTTAYCTGRARVLDGAEPARPDLEQARAGCAGAEIPAARVYDLCARAGLEHGPALRSLSGLRTGTDASGHPQVLAELRLPDTAEPHPGWVLHPAVLDGAMQATVGLRLAGGGPGHRGARPALPFAVKRVDVHGATSARAFAWVRYQRGSGPDTALPLLDVTVFDEQGRVSADLTGLSTRALRDAPETALTGPQESPGASVVRPSGGGVDIAVIGVSGRYPEAADLDEFWENLRSGRDSVRRLPEGRWPRPGWQDADGRGDGESGDWGGFLDGIDLFDPLFFQISQREAEFVDPHERLFLQCAYHVLEDAGYTAELLNRTSGSVGVFTGVMYQDYQLYGAQAQEHGRPVALSGSASSVANRVSYFHGFTGPSMSVDTMCSSSLTAIHLACEAIRNGQCGAALAGGVNLTSHPNKYLMLRQRNYLSSDGRCRSFGAGGDGYVPGEGVGAVLLKPLARAIADGDHIHAVIKGTALNHGGRTNGYTVPSPAAQSRVIGQALAASGVDPRSVSYVEAHGTGTSLGDPIEVAGLVRAFEEAGCPPEQCAIGSVKSNIGHAESAAGIAGVTKVLLQMRHRELVPSLHASTLNPHIDFAGTPLRVQRHLEPWRRPAAPDDGTVFPRVAGVSSFGAGGANAHIVLTEYEMPATEPAHDATGRPALLVLSAMSEAQLVEQARRLRTRLAELSAPDLPAVAWTLQTGRAALQERLAFAAGSLDEARALLADFADAPERPGGWVRGTVLTEVTPDEAELAAALDDWSRDGSGDRLLRLWAAGTPVPWETVQAAPGPDGTGGRAPRPRRVPLPGYPFARERCWIDVGTGTTGETAGPAAATARAGTAGTGRGSAAPDTEVVLLRPGWTARTAAPAPAAGARDDRSAPAGGTRNVQPVSAAGGRDGYAAHHVTVVGTLTADERAAVRAALPAQADCRFLDLAEGPLDRQYGEAARAVLTRVQEVLRPGLPRPVLFQVALAQPTASAADRDRLACLRGLTGLLRTAGLEHPHLHTQLVDCLDGAPAATVAARLAAEAAEARQAPEHEVRYRDGVRYAAVLDEVAAGGAPAAPWREGGVYLVTGGTGALGRIVAGDIAAAVRHATVVLTGRSALTGDQQNALDALRAAGLTVEHRRADVADRASVDRLLAEITAAYGPLTGIVHGAGVVEDRLIAGKSTAELERVLAPKVAGLVHLDELSHDQPLEFLACLSSASGTFGNVGQADYAAANAFMDAYAEHRNLLVAAGERSGRTVSVGWPLWADGGMGTDEATSRRLRSLGLAPLATERGLAILRRALTDRDATGDGRLVVFAGRRAMLPGITGAERGPAARTGAGLADGPGAGAGLPHGTGAAGSATAASAPAGSAIAATEATAVSVPDGDDGRLLEERAVGRLRRTLADVLKLAPERLHPDVELERYGMDSVLAVSAVGGLEEAFGPLARTLLIERPTLRELARYFAEEHPAALRALLGEPAAAPAPAVPGEPDAPAAAPGGGIPEPTSPVQGARTASVPQRAESRRDENRGEFMDVAVIGIAGRYPGAEDLDTFWVHLRDGRDCVTEPPAGRWDEAHRTGTWGGFLDGIDRFDPVLFGISPREAALMDPQQRLFLETVWELLEGSGVTQEVIERQYGRHVGVYAGAAYQLYRMSHADGSDPALVALTATASYNLIANRVSHFFGLEGPSLAVDSMCTSSAMAIHLACADLHRGECELAVAGGVNLATSPDKFLALAEMEMLGSHPGSRSFRDGDGYLPAEAVGAVLLKPLDAALRDGDTVHLVIKGTASVHSGRASGFLAPSRRAQVTAMRRALERAGAAPDTIGYVESSANGTAMSDEIELSALREVFDGADQPVAVGSVKSILGHPEAASGVAQITKVALQLRHRELAPLSDVGDPNPNLDLAGGPLTLCERPAPWEERRDPQGRPVPRRALINSVAAGGSHVSLVVEAPPGTAAEPEPATEAGPQVVVVSATTPARLRRTVQRLHDALGSGAEMSLADVAYTLQLGREALPERLAAVVAGVAELRECLARYLAEGDGSADRDAPAGARVHTGNAEQSSHPLLSVLAGARGEEFLAALVADGDLEQLAELWVCGARIPWSGLHPRRRRPVPLPGTVFERESYWLDGAALPHRAGTPAASAPPASSGTAPAASEPGRSSGTAPAASAPGRSSDTTSAAAAPEPTPARPAGKEGTVLAVCAELLGYRPDAIGVDDNFLALGGHSLLAHRFATLLRERGLRCDPAAVLRARSLAAIAAAAEEAPGEAAQDPGAERSAGAAEPAAAGTSADAARAPLAPAAGAPAPARAGIPAGTTRITPDMLPLVSLTEQELAAVVAAVPGGAANLQDVYPLGPMQEGMYFHHVREGAHDPYVASGLFSFADRDCLDRFAQALRAVVDRHDALRTVILSDGLSGPVQAVLRQVDVPVDEIELHSGTPADDQLADVLRTAPSMPLDQAPLIRLRAGRHPDTGGWHAALTLHHTLHDASSLGLLFTELVAHMEGAADALPEPVPYRDFIAHTLRRPDGADPAAFFGGLLGDVSEPTVMFGLHDVHGDGQQVLEVRRPLDADLGRRLRAVAARLRVSPATLFHAGWALTVAACADRDDVTFGTVMSGRVQGPAGMDRMIGTFINTLPVRLDLAGRSARDLVRATEEVLHGLLRLEQVPLTEARAHSGLPGPETPLFNAVFNYRHLPADDGIDRRLQRVGITPLSDVLERSNYPVTVSVDDHGDAFVVDALIHRAQDANVVVDCLEAAMAALADALADEAPADRPALELSVLPAAMRERETATFAWEPAAAGDSPERSERLLQAWFEDVVRAAPDAEAVRCEDRRLSYGELNARANRLARHLRALGVARESLVALCLPRSEWLVVCALAVVKAGGAYVPVDPSAPAERLGHVLGDSAPRVLLVDGGVPDGLDAGAATVVDVSADADQWADLPAGDLEPVAQASPADLAYVIYTSGSTGLPKGVMVPHRHVCRFLIATQPGFDYRPDDVWTLFHSFAFDFTVWEMWGALLHRGCLVVVTQEVARSPQDFYRLLCDEGVTMLGQTPTGMGQLIAAQGDDGAPHRVRTILLGGEELDASTLAPWFPRAINKDTKLVNMWGTTETGVVTTYREVTEPDTRLTTRPIGRPMPALSVYVLDRHGNPVPTGAVGELVIGGEAMARGYLNRPELTAERFLDDPFCGTPGARMYRTGDLGRRLPDGTLEFLGRTDGQVKIRGYRIELGEISTRLNEHPAVADARVVVRGQGDDRRLVGYVVPSDRARVVRELARLRRTEQDVLDRVHELPDGRPVFHGGQDDVDARHAEIFTDLGYLRHGITLGPDARVVDAGAGVGLFTLFAAAYAPGARLYAFESEATLADALRRNVALHGIDARVFAHGLSAGPAQHTSDGAADDHRPPTLSDVIAEHGLDRIDLLRVAGPDAGHDVLCGIADADWSGIRQLVVDLRDTDARLKEAVALLEEHGFDVVSEPDGGPGHETAAYRLFARRPADGGTESAEASAPRALPAPAWPNERVLREDLDAALRAALPSYMVPAGYVVLDRLPLTGNGKLDQRALPDPVAVARPGEQGTAPRTEAERTVAEVWAELLATDADRIDVASNFFSLGGNSLLVTRMINMIKQRTGVELRVQTIFGAERLADLAAEVVRRTPDTGPAAPLDVASISESISLVESLTDAELDALDIDDTDLDTES